jgi:hypothetical protein
MKFRVTRDNAIPKNFRSKWRFLIWFSMNFVKISSSIGQINGSPVRRSTAKSRQNIEALKFWKYYFNFFLIIFTFVLRVSREEMLQNDLARNIAPFLCNIPCFWYHPAMHAKIEVKCNGNYNLWKKLLIIDKLWITFEILYRPCITIESTVSSFRYSKNFSMKSSVKVNA